MTSDLDPKLPELIREIRETADFVLNLPRKLASMIPDAFIAHHDRKERIRIQKEIVELREIGKVLQRMYLFKGDFISWAKEVSERQRDEDIEFVKEIFSEVAGCLDEAKKALHDTSFSNSSLATEASLMVAKFSRCYRALSNLPDDTLLTSGHIFELCNLVEKMEREAADLIKNLDDHRRLLDHTYG